MSRDIARRPDSTGGEPQEVGKPMRVVTGGQYATPRHRRVKRRASAREQWDMQVQFERDMRAAYGAIYGEDGSVPSKGIYHIRDGSQAPWRTTERRTTEANLAGAPLADITEPLRVHIPPHRRAASAVGRRLSHPDEGGVTYAWLVPLVLIAIAVVALVVSCVVLWSASGSAHG